MINLATKYSGQVDKIYTHESYVAGKAKAKYEFTGVRGVKIYSPQTVPLVDYKRSGSNRYGDPKEMQDEVQELVVTQDKGFALTIDKGNASEQMGTKNAGARLRQQIEEQVTPEQDKYALAQYIRHAGKVAGVAVPTASTIYKLLLAAKVEFNNHKVPLEGRYCFIGSTNEAVLSESDKITNLENLGTTAFEKGVVYKCAGFKIVSIPDDLLPDDCYFLCVHGNSIANPHKIHDTKLHTDPPGISGHLMEGRFIYDAFVTYKKSSGVYAAVLAAKKQATPTISVSGTTATITSAGATSVKVTTDGSDPRYSSTAATISTGGTVTVASKDVVKAVAYGTFTSDVATSTVA